MRRSPTRRITLGALAATVPLLAAAPVSAAPLNTEPLVQVSGASPIAGCTLDGPQSGTVFLNTEVEPHIAVNPVNPDNLIAAWQQDRYSNGGSQGNVTASSFDGGQTWTHNAQTRSSLCTGGTDANGGGYERASDPWLTFSPDGTAYLMSLSVDDSPEGGGFGTSPNAMLAMRSVDGGVTWADPVTLRRDDNPNVLNDKNTMTADPNDADAVYAVWDRLVSPPGEAAPPRAFENTIAFQGPVLFSRTTDGGDTWEPAREIYDPGTLNQTIGNQIVVLPDNDQFDGELVNVFDLIRNASNRQGTRGFSIALIRSADQGTTWDRRETIVDRHRPGEVTDPDDGDPVRTGEILPEVAVDPASGAIYLVWQDARFGPASSVAFTRSLDGGRTWSPTIKINATPTDVPMGNQQAFTPMVRVSSDGTIGVSYYDFRNNPADPAVLGTDAWLVHCHPATADCTDPNGWGDETRLTDATFDMAGAPVARGFFVGDYEGLDVVGAEFQPLWSMPHTGDGSSVFTRRVGE